MSGSISWACAQLLDKAEDPQAAPQLRLEAATALASLATTHELEDQQEAAQQALKTLAETTSEQEVFLSAVSAVLEMEASKKAKEEQEEFSRW